MRKLKLNENFNVLGGTNASIGRCQAMHDRWVRRGSDTSTRLYARIQKKCQLFD